MNKIKGLQFQKKLFILIALFLLSLFGILSVGVSIFVYRNSISDAEALHRETVEAQAQKVEQMILDMDAISVQLVGNSTIQNIFLDVAEQENTENYFENNLQKKRNLERECSYINMAKNMVDAIYIFREPYDFFSYNTERYDKKRVLGFLDSEEVHKYTDYQGEYYKVVGPHMDWWTSDEENKVISLIRPLVATYYSKEEIATIEVQYRYSKLQAICAQKDKSNGIAITIIDEATGEIIYPYDETEFSGCKDVPEIGEQKVQIIEMESGEKLAAYKHELKSCNWSIIGTQSYRQYMDSTRVILTLIAVLCIGFTVLALGGVFLVTRQLTLPIRNLRTSLGNITLDNVIITNNYEGNNEIELLQESFQQVLTALQKSAQQVTISQTAEYQAKIDALQAQINPHFLYNSLMSISAAGQERDALKVQNMCSQLSDLFRYASSGGGDASLNEEIDNVENYLAFMKFRYLDDLDFVFERCRTIEKVRVPKLILQPIIENCFQHGFYTVEPPFFVKISCFSEGKRWYLEIMDNGGGFTKERLEEIESLRKRIDEILVQRNHGERVDTYNMAILNVYARMKIRYGDKVTFSLKNREERGAVVLIGGELDG